MTPMLEIEGLIERLADTRPLHERVRRLGARFEAQAIGLSKLKGSSPQVIGNLMWDARTLAEAAILLRTLETSNV